MLSSADKKNLKRFGEHVASIRRKKKLSLRQVSYACDIDNSKISKIEKGRVNVTLTTLLQLAEALEVSLPELMDYTL
ncbi:MAG: helix-turn-helix transcriptional regulator [Chitinophagaceae bacterium]|nr:helix-turn-helix transcriptional regulator [Chitinophagaceae bacterium]MCW5926216.1 helix-turn-helix transcriptional regulator [Chitinophagaceae bacterium]